MYNNEAMVRLLIQSKGVLVPMNQISKAILLMTCLNIPFFNGASAAVSSTEQCDAPFGTVIGENSNTIAYSNCNNDHESELWQSVTLDDDRTTIKTGMQWQCVEYARRWLITQMHYTFASIDHAYQIWDLSEATDVLTGEKTVWNKLPNNKSTHSPQKGDLLIYDRSQGMHGHVAVIVDVNEHSVFIGEQNYSNQLWEGSNYARELPLLHTQEGYYKIEDQGVIGWIHIPKKPE